MKEKRKKKIVVWRTRKQSHSRFLNNGKSPNHRIIPEIQPRVFLKEIISICCEMCGLHFQPKLKILTYLHGEASALVQFDKEATHSIMHNLESTFK